MVLPTNLTKSQLDAQYDTAAHAASIALGTSASMAYFDKEVTQASTLGKIVGLFKYCFFFNHLAKLITGEYAKEANIVEFNAKAQDLVKALAERDLTLEEAHNNPISAKVTTTVEGRRQIHEAQLKAEEAEKAFYKVFKKRCEDLTATGADKFAIHHAGAMKVLARTAEVDFPAQKTMGIKLETLNASFQGRVFNDILETFAKLPAASITVDSYKKLVTDLNPATNRFCEKMTETQIATKLRQAIKAEHTGDVIAKLAGKFADATSAEYQALQTELRTKVDAEKLALELELGAMCGTKGNDGTVNAAWLVLEAARKALTTAETNFTTEFAKAFPGVSVTSTAAELAKLNFAAHPELITAQDAYKAKVTEVETAQKAFDDITTKLNTLGQWTNGQLTGGKVFEAQTLASVGFNAHVELAAAKLGTFYTELNQVVDPANQDARQTAMKAIID